ncbi:hypothetical protein ES319_D05G369700v1 [Gossypium barbadense]|uniref:Uncharacterized protein n=1 Tax=Gossypium barbadense TaxID=3634 RepID=A0A5J5RN75_GOSBA|nr:hypothetical protein ES319_D05G369700v1 [Gossypium barbadense]
MTIFFLFENTTADSPPLCRFRLRRSEDALRRLSRRWVLEEACATWAVAVRSCMEIVAATWDNGGVDLLLTTSTKRGRPPTTLTTVGTGRGMRDVGSCCAFVHGDSCCDVGQWWRRSAADCNPQI